MLFRNLLLTLLCLSGKAIFIEAETPASKYKKFLKPCFADEHYEEELISEACTADSCPKRENKETTKSKKEGNEEDFKLFRLDGVKTGYTNEVDIGDGRKYKMITRAMKPLMFEIPNFLTDDECDKLIEMAKESGLVTSVAGFDAAAYEGDLEKELSTVGDKSDWEKIPKNRRAGRKFLTWDRNNDEVIDLDEIRSFALKYFLLFLTDEDLTEMFQKLNFKGFENADAIGWQAFRELNVKAMMIYLDFIKTKHPRHRPRFSQQAWLEQNKRSSPLLKLLQDRVRRITKLPRKIIRGSESLQVVRYTKHGHYHTHLDSNPKNRTDIPCCHQDHEPKAPECRVCRFATLLYYLNDVEEGGETAFIVADNETYSLEALTDPNNPTDEFNLSVNCHKANLVVKPMKGTAIMWYNHHIDPESGLLGKIDPYSLHGGCDILRGDKWIANNWITAPIKQTAHLKSVYDVDDLLDVL